MNQLLTGVSTAKSKAGGRQRPRDHRMASGRHVMAFLLLLACVMISVGCVWMYNSLQYIANMNIGTPASQTYSTGNNMRIADMGGLVPAPITDGKKNISEISSPLILPRNGSKPLSDNSIPRKGRGLYLDAPEVQEIDKDTFKHLVLGKSKRSKVNGDGAASTAVVLFYASWCGHCRHFVPIYRKIARDVNDKIQKYNTARDQKKRTVQKIQHGDALYYPPLKFLAVNCVEYAKTCREHHVRAYPAAVLFHHGYQKGDMVSGASEKRVMSLIKENYFDKSMLVPLEELQKLNASFNQMIYTSASTLESSQTNVVSKEQQVEILYANHASASIRWNDAVTSLNFLLMKELPREWTPELINTLSNFLLLSSRLLPMSQSKASIMYATIAQRLHSLKYVSSNGVNKYIEASVKDFYSHSSMQWKACGVYISASDAISSTTAAAAATSKAHDDAGIGYTCGLWFLFHSLSLAAERSQLQHKNTLRGSIHHVTAVAVMQAIMTIVRDFFGCSYCRVHFMEAYDGCLYSRCEIGPKDFDLLQMWLFHQHSSVAAHTWQYQIIKRIKQEQEEEIKEDIELNKQLDIHHSSSSSNVISNITHAVSKIYITWDEEAEAQPSFLWPSLHQCPECYNTNHPIFSLLKLPLEELIMKLSNKSTTVYDASVVANSGKVLRFLRSSYY